MNEPDSNSPEAESRFHYYLGSSIPWYVRLMWVGFWCLAVWYFVAHLFPDLRRELLTPP